MTVRTLKTPRGLKVTVTVTRGDLTLTADTSAATVGDVARFLTHTVRTITASAPDLLPVVETVGGSTVPFAWDDASEDTRQGVGFR